MCCFKPCWTSWTFRYPESAAAWGILVLIHRNLFGFMVAPRSVDTKSWLQEVPIFWSPLWTTPYWFDGVLESPACLGPASYPVLIPFPKASQRWWSSTTLPTDLYVLLTLRWWGTTPTPVASLASKVDQLWRGRKAIQGCSWVSPGLFVLYEFVCVCWLWSLNKKKQNPNQMLNFEPNSSNPFLLPRFGRAVARMKTNHLKAARRAAHRFLHDAAAGDHQLDVNDKVSKFWMEHANLQPIFAF